MEDRLNLDELAALIFAPGIEPGGQVRCEHIAGDGRAYGWHHHAGPHACDWASHGDECPWAPLHLGPAVRQLLSDALVLVDRLPDVDRHAWEARS